MMNPTEKAVLDPSAEFLRDIRPFFHGRAMTYVDAGAYHGNVLRQLIEAKFKVHDAYLFEPNVESYDHLQKNREDFSKVNNLKIFNTALGDRQASARMVQAGTMSRILPESDDIPGLPVVQVDTLDQMMFREQVGKISILKVDVEGHESRLLEGAKGLLASHAIDVVYIEAGISSGDGQHVGLQEIQRALSTHGYAVFRFYEQVNEWREDSPLLRRVNAAFMSKSFAQNHPLSVTNDLFKERFRVRSLKKELRAVKAELEDAEGRIGLAAREAEDAVQRLREERMQLEVVTRRLRETEEIGRQLSEEVGRERRARCETERRLRGMRRNKARALEAERAFLQVTQSTSWKLTRPVRRLAVFLGSLLGKQRDLEVRLPSARATTVAPRRDADSRDIQAVEWLRKKLLALGLTGPVLERLEEFSNARERPLLRRLACRELVAWYVSHAPEEHRKRALEFLPGMLEGLKGPQSSRRALIMAAEAMRINGNPEEARRLLRGIPEDTQHPDVFLANANVAESDQERVEAINLALEWAGLEPVAIGPGQRPAYDRLVCARTIEGVVDGPLVSVIVPVYNAQATIQTALDSLLAQSWRNLEILAVDDQSTDNTIAILEEIAGRDPRLKILRAEQNGGPYVARNLALREAKGEYVTCHDADDWAHPRKIELQARHLATHASAVANVAVQARTTDALVFNMRGKIGEFVFDNISSLMFRREPVTARLGYWDSVRFMADGEFIRRIRRVFGHGSISVLDKALTCFQRYTENSLTASAPFGYSGFLFGARREYFEATNHYHSEAKSFRYEFPMTRRPMAVPAPLTRRGSGTVRYDVIIASDFRLAGGSTLSSLEEVQAMVAAGMRVGLVAMYRFDIDPMRATFNRKLRALINEGKVDVIVYGQDVECDLLLVRYPPVLQHVQRYIPTVRAKNIRVIVNQPPMSDYGPKGVVRYRIPDAAANLKKMFGRSGVWHPIGPAVRNALEEHHGQDLGAIELSDWDWGNIIDVEAWRRRGRPHGGRRPVIGRHARDHVVKWPGSHEDILQVYPDSEAYEVRIMGGAEVPRRLLGGQLPGNWEVIKFDGMTPREYLSGLDVFVYYTHPDWVESFGRVIIEAMAVGVPVVVPPSYMQLFGDAAVYADLEHALDAVDRLMSDPEVYRAQVERAFAYVHANFGYAMHIERVHRLHREQKETDEPEVCRNADR